MNELLMFLNLFLVVRDCNDVKKSDYDAQNGVYSIIPFEDVTQNLEAFCQFDSDNNGWTVSFFNYFKLTTISST